MKNEIVMNAYYAILSEYAAFCSQDYENYLNLKQLSSDNNWEGIYEAYENDEPISGTVVFSNAIGLIIDIWGYKGFIPFEEIDYKCTETRKSYIGQIIDCRIIRMDYTKKMFVLSHKDCLSHYIPKFIESSKGITKGLVCSISDDEILISLDMFDGYVRLNELHNAKQNSLTIGSIIDLGISGFDEERGMFQLSLL